ncbi:MAG: hypothetical protein J6Y20_07030 [Lachnospiraceae bacterium]|nr:hypothetical protein [Lachnospiraceae bacterium]
MSRIGTDGIVESAEEEKERELYYHIILGGKRERGCIVAPPSDLTDEEMEYYKRLSAENNGRIPIKFD